MTDTTTHEAARCQACGAVIVRTPLNPQQFYTADTGALPKDACPWCTANDWTLVTVQRLDIRR